MKIWYEASDGTRFEKEEECLFYENNNKDNANIQFFNMFGHKSRDLEDICFIVINTNEWSVLEFIREKIMHMPSTHYIQRGVYTLGIGSAPWINITEMVKSFKGGRDK